ncbi:MAG TPA: hypothetical protein VMC41_04000 [Candidatus Nanoarchaeia archaeon]|nr:hypothetical protein [Candidatus Nanoarchaeia archaeon]
MENFVWPSTKQFRYFYGAIRLVSTGEEGEKTEKYPTCLFDLQERTIRLFRAPAELGEAINALISPVGSESYPDQIDYLPSKRGTAEIDFDDWDNRLVAEEALENQGEEASPFDLSATGAIYNDRARNMGKFSRVEFGHLLEENLRAIAEEEAVLEKLAADIRKKSKKRRLVKERRLPDYIEGVAPTLAILPRDFDEVENPNDFYGPYFRKEQFTDDLEVLPPELRHMFVNLDVFSALANVVRDVVEVAFNPEKAKTIRRSKGLTGKIGDNSTNTDVVMAEIKARR